MELDLSMSDHARARKVQTKGHCLRREQSKKVTEYERSNVFKVNLADAGKMELFQGRLAIFNFAKLRITSHNFQLNFGQLHFSHLAATSTPNYAY